MNKLTTVILAAGHGKRMKSSLPKVLHKISGKPMVEHVVDVARSVESDNIICVVGHGRDIVIDSLKHLDLKFVVQEEQLGTGHAVMMADEFIKEGDVLVLFGDVPLLSEKTLMLFVDEHRFNKNDASVLTTILNDPSGYGRIVRNEGKVEKIVEHKDATIAERAICEINSGIMIVKAHLLKAMLSRLDNNNEQREYYLTDVFELINKSGGKVDAFIAEDDFEVMGVNDRYQLSIADEYMQARIKKEWMLNGVTMILPGSIYIEKNVVIESDAIIYPNSILKGKTVVGERAEIGPSADIKDTIIKSDVTIKHSTVVESIIDEGSAIGPYAYLRPKSNIGKNVKIGDFVEVKNCFVGDNSKVSHLSYIGDGEIGENVNVGCGVVFVNYDGSKKHLTKIESDAFIGCNSNLVAPVIVGKGAYVAAGSTITENVPEGALAIARERQTNKADWLSKYNKKG